MLAIRRCALRRVALLAEQQLRKSAEDRLGTELRKAIKLANFNQEITTANTRLQQQLKEAKAEVCSALRFNVSHSTDIMLVLSKPTYLTLSAVTGGEAAWREHLPQDDVQGEQNASPSGMFQDE